MSLIALLIALFANPQLPPGGWRSARGFYAYAAWLQARLMPLGVWNSGLGVALLCLPLIVPIVLLQVFIGDMLWGLVGVVLGVVALCFAFGGGETLEAEVAAFDAAWRQGDEAGAQTALAALAGGSVETAVNYESMPEAAAGHVVLRARTRLFAPIFWFLVLGPVGALGYRLVVMARAFGDWHDNAGPDYSARAGQLVALVDWLPDRLMALSMALAGHFSAAWSVWDREASATASRRLAETGLGALGVPLAESPRDLTADAVGDVHTLIRRALYVWLAFVALAVLLGLG